MIAQERNRPSYYHNPIVQRWTTPSTMMMMVEMLEKVEIPPAGAPAAFSSPIFDGSGSV
jgi:hypothetical protein